MKKQINIEYELEGRYTLQVRKVATDEIVKQLEFKNLITNSGLDHLPLGGSNAYCKVGSGSTPPTVNDTSLQGQVAVTTATVNSSSSGTGSSPYWTEQSTTYRFAQGAAAGNLSEVGIGWQTGIFSRALILDNNGNPTTITILSDEYLDVTYTLRQYPVITDFTFSFQVGGVTYNATGRAANVTTWNVTPSGTAAAMQMSAHYGPSISLGAVTTSLQNVTNSEGGINSTVRTYSSGSYQRITDFDLGLNTANFPGGINAFVLYTGTQGLAVIAAQYQIVLDKPIPKTSSTVLTLVTNYSWGRYTPS